MNGVEPAKARRALGDPKWWLALASAIVVASMALVSTERTTPGALSNAHGRIVELAGASSCAECHGGWFESMQAACLDCHGFIGEHMESGRGLHGAIGALAANCASCHSEHHGGDFDLVGRHSFAKAGVADPAQFDHALVGFAMEGKHLELACTECHEHAATKVLPEGARRYVGLSQDCASCHADPHAGAMARACTECHTQSSFDQHLSVGHERHLPLIGGHGALDCRTCHDAAGAHALENYPAPATGPSNGLAAQGQDARTCAECHASPHGAPFLAGNAALAGIRLESGCVGCHVPAHTSFRDQSLVLDPDQHACSGFPLVPPHQEVRCAKCHDPALTTFAERYPGRDRDGCAACHTDVHGGQFATGPFAEQGCVVCHGRERFTPHSFDVHLHARTSLPLDGQHLEVACEACHTAPHTDAPRTFHKTPNACGACHADAHGGFFDARSAQLEPIMHGDCARCHDATAFAPVPPERFHHEPWTGFPLDGAHAQEGCAACHHASREPDATGRRFGRAAELFGHFPPLAGGPEVGQACAVCHADPHAGGFNAPHLPADFSGETGCARCHGSASFRDLPRGFDHGLWTGFKLSGAHGALDCAQCHGPLWPPDAAGRTWMAAHGNNCADCHADPHGGQFAREGAVDCARCHKDPSSWMPRSFDHNWDTRFPLDSTHAALDCSACHQPKRIEDVDTYHYRPLGMECTDCHGVQTGSLRRRGNPR